MAQHKWFFVSSSSGFNGKLKNRGGLQGSFSSSLGRVLADMSLENKDEGLVWE